MKKLRTKFLLITLFAVLFSFSQTKPFDRAYGAAAYSNGGAGKPVYKVTTLQPTGEGSISEAIADAKTTDGGNIVFEVSGRIRFPFAFFVRDLNNTTFWGQSAPEGGITFTNIPNCSSCRTQVIDCNNLIFRYLKFRPHFLENSFDGFEVISSSNIIVDHCSFNWGGDEGLSTRVFSTNPVHDITFQRNIIAESKTASLVGYSQDPDLAYNFSYQNNLIINCDHRFPNVTANGRTDVINNVIYDWYSRLSVFDGDGEINHIGNSYYLGNKTELNMLDNGSSHALMCIVTGNTGANMSVYSNDTYIEDNYPVNNLNESDLFYLRGPDDNYGNTVKAPLDIQTTTIFPLLGDAVPITSAISNYDDVINDVGANAYINDEGVAVRSVDDLDLHYINMIGSGVHEFARAPEDDFNGFPVNAFDYLFEHYDKYIDYHESFTSTPINTRPTSYDANNDGIADVWASENMNGALATDVLPNGRTWLQTFYNQVDNLESFLVENVQESNTTQNSTTITWNAVTDATSYVVYRDEVQQSIVTNGTAYNDSGLTANTTYNYRVDARDVNDDVLGSSQTLSVTTSASVVIGTGASRKAIINYLIQH